jgi:hypothetical protein
VIGAGEAFQNWWSGKDGILGGIMVMGVVEGFLARH